MATAFCSFITTVGIKENSFDKSILLSQNPTSGKIKLDISTNEIMDVAIYSSDGKLVYSKRKATRSDNIFG